MMQEYIDLLKSLIATPSLSRNEAVAAELVRSFLHERGVQFSVHNNNSWAVHPGYSPVKKTILLNSHIDTVRPAQGWSVDPFTPIEEGDRITGLGSNDAGGPLVALIAVFLHFYKTSALPFNLVFAATAEEENSGLDGMESIIPKLPPIDFAIVGEPTGMDLALAEKGLLVLDCTAHGKSGHAAREEGINALYKAIADIEQLRSFRFEKVSPLLGEVKISVTQIEAGTQHNVVPDICRFVVDVRTNELYSNQEACDIIAGLITSEVKPRSIRLNSSGIPETHPFALIAQQMGIRCYGSPTTSDQAIMPWPSVKIGPGDSARSHTANEYILKSEISEGINQYIRMLGKLEL